MKLAMKMKNRVSVIALAIVALALFGCGDDGNGGAVNDGSGAKFAGQTVETGGVGEFLYGVVGSDTSIGGRNMGCAQRQAIVGLRMNVSAVDEHINGIGIDCAAMSIDDGGYVVFGPVLELPMGGPADNLKTSECPEDSVMSGFQDRFSAVGDGDGLSTLSITCVPMFIDGDGNGQPEIASDEAFNGATDAPVSITGPRQTCPDGQVVRALSAETGPIDEFRQITFICIPVFTDAS